MFFKYLKARLVPSGVKAFCYTKYKNYIEINKNEQEWFIRA